MTKRQWKYRFYEEDELDIDDILDDTDDNDTPEDFSTGDEDISSQIKTLVSREVKRLTTDNPPETKDSSSVKTESPVERKDPPEVKTEIVPKKPETSSVTHKDNRKHTPIPPHSSPSYPSHRHSRTSHKPRNHRSNNRTTTQRKVRPVNHYNVEYHNLEPINTYPNNKKGLVPFTNRIIGNFIIFSPITSSNFEPTKRMHDVLRFRQMCMSRKLQHLPIYTLDDRNRIIDISLLVFPHDNSEEEYEKLPDLVKKSDMGNGDYVGCKNGHITLWMPFPLHYKENNLTRIMTHYLRDRGVFVENGSRLYLNPPPQSQDERSFRTRLGEVIPSPCNRDNLDTISQYSSSSKWKNRYNLNNEHKCSSSRLSHFNILKTNRIGR